MIRFRQKIYTVYDETDSLKRMKDSDILAQEKKSENFGSQAVGGALGGAALGVGAGVGLAAGKIGLNAAKAAEKGTKWAAGTSAIGKSATNLANGGVGNALKKIGSKGAALGVLGAGIGLAHTLIKQAPKRKEINQYNDRLDYAQRHALRREKADWANNNLNREGYTY